jgi:hypothetical protein
VDACDCIRVTDKAIQVPELPEQIRKLDLGVSRKVVQGVYSIAYDQVATLPISNNTIKF